MRSRTISFAKGMQQPMLNLCQITTKTILPHEFYSSMPIICTVMQWVSPSQHEILNLCLTCKKVATDDIGFILEVDFKYPLHLHESHNDYPLASKKVTITQDMLSPDSQSLINKCSSTEKLAPNLNDKIKYVLHCENLRLYLELKMELVQIHKILQFCQSACIKPCIDFNTTKRKESMSSFLQNMFKLFINSLFGKTMECLRNRINVKLVTNPIRAKKLIARPLRFSDSILSTKIWHQSLWWKTTFSLTDRYILVV